MDHSLKLDDLHTVIDLGTNYGAASSFKCTQGSGYNFYIIQSFYISFLLIEKYLGSEVKEMNIPFSPCFRKFRDLRVYRLHCLVSG